MKLRICVLPSDSGRHVWREKEIRPTTLVVLKGCMLSPVGVQVGKILACWSYGTYVWISTWEVVRDFAYYRGVCVDWSSRDDWGRWYIRSSCVGSEILQDVYRLELYEAMSFLFDGITNSLARSSQWLRCAVEPSTLCIKGDYWMQKKNLCQDHKEGVHPRILPWTAWSDMVSASPCGIWDHPYQYCYLFKWFCSYVSTIIPLSHSAGCFLLSSFNILQHLSSLGYSSLIWFTLMRAFTSCPYVRAPKLCTVA